MQRVISYLMDIRGEHLYNCKADLKSWGLCWEGRMNTYPVLNSVERKIVERLGDDVRRIAIFGCDDGRIARALRDRFREGNLQITGVEEDEELAKEASSSCDILLTKPLAEVRGTDFKQDLIPFDTVIYCDIEKHFSEPFSTLAHQKALVKEGGKVFFSFTNSQFVGNSAAVINSGLLFDFLGFQDLSVRHPMTFPIVGRLLSMLSYVPAYVFGVVSNHYATWQKEKEKAISLDRLEVKARNELEAFQLCAYLMLIEAENRRPEPEKEKPPQVQYQPLAIGDIRSVRYRYPRKYWKRLSDHFLALEEAGIPLPDVPDRSSEFVTGKVLILEPKPTSALVIGCSYGRLLKALRQKDAEIRLTGIDPAEGAIQAAKRYLKGEDVELRVHSPEEPLPFEDNAFDVVITNGLLSAVYPDCLEHLLGEIQRVSKKFAVHDEDMRRDDPRIMGYNLAEIYVKKGTKTTYEKDPTGSEPQQLQFVVAEVKSPHQNAT